MRRWFQRVEAEATVFVTKLDRNTHVRRLQSHFLRVMWGAWREPPESLALTVDDRGIGTPYFREKGALLCANPLNFGPHPRTSEVKVCVQALRPETAIEGILCRRSVGSRLIECAIKGIDHVAAVKRKATVESTFNLIMFATA